jgi:hypothetical protein
MVETFFEIQGESDSQQYREPQRKCYLMVYPRRQDVRKTL